MEHDCCTPTATSAGAARTRSDDGRPLVEILSFEGCPNRNSTIALVERTAASLGFEPDIQLIDVPDKETAARLRFLGSPSVRIGGSDVEPGGDARTDFTLACRLYRTDAGYAGEPDEQWVRAALLRQTPRPTA